MKLTKFREICYIYYKTTLFLLFLVDVSSQNVIFVPLLISFVYGKEYGSGLKICN